MATSLTAPNAGDLVRAAHIAPIANLLNGTTSSDNIPVALINHSSTSNYSLRVRNQSTSTTAPLFKVSTNTGGSEATVMDVTAAGIVGGKFYDKGGVIFNVRAYATGGPLSVGFGGSTSADTLAIEAAIAALKAASIAQLALGGDGRLGWVYLPAGTWNVFRTIDASGLVGALIAGDGVQATRFGLATGTGAEAGDYVYWSTKPMMDVSGGNFIRLQNFAIQPDNTASSATVRIPQVGLLMGQNAIFTNWLGSEISANVANANYCDNIRVAGAFLKACHVNYAVPSSVYVRCDFNRAKSNNTTSSTYQNGQNMNQAALILTRDNQTGASAGGAVTLLDYTSGVGSCSDLTFLDCEIHDSCNGGSGACTCPALWLDEAYDIRFYGGNISGFGNAGGYVRMSPGKTLGGTLTGCRNIIFDGMFMYNEGAGTLVTNAFRLTGNNADNAAIVRGIFEQWPDNSTTVTIVASDVTIRNCQISTVDQGTLISGGRYDGAGGETAYFVRWHVENVQMKDDTSPVFDINDSYLALGGGTDVLEFRDSYLECHGNRINTNGGALKRCKLIRPGTITSTRIYHGDFTIHGGGAVSLAAAGTAYYGAGSANATEGSVIPIVIPMGMRVWYLRVCTATAPGGGQTLTFTLRKATPSTAPYDSVGDTALTSTISGTAAIAAVTAGATNVEYAEGTVMNLKVVASAGAATTAWISYSVVCIPMPSSTTE